MHFQQPVVFVDGCGFSLILFFWARREHKQGQSKKMVKFSVEAAISNVKKLGGWTSTRK